MATSTTDPPGAAPDDDQPYSAATEDNGASSWQASDNSSWGRWQRDHNDHYSSDWGSWDNSSWGWGDRWSWQPTYYYNNNRSVHHRDSPWGTGTTWSQASQFYGTEQPNRRENDEEQRSNDTSEEQGASDATLPDEASQEHRRFSSATLGSSEATRAPSGRGRDESGTSLSGASGTAGYKGSFSEKMAVPSFGAKGTGDELGMSARSYLRQVEAWSKVTRTDPTQQALLLYQNLSDRAWVESEELNVEDLASPQGLKVFTSWIRERYQEVEVSRIAEALTLFFKKMKRQAGQSIREFNSVFDRGHSRLLEIDCRLPEVARAWAYLNALGLSSSEELSLLASVGNDYSTAKLQKAAILHEKSLRGPWVPRNKGDGKGAKSAFLAGVGNDEPQHGLDDVDGGDEPGPYLDEETAIEIHEAFVAQESAKARYRDVIKARGVDPETLKSSKKGAEEPTKTSSDESLAQAKLRSYCAGCGRRGHWHKDAECPLNRAGNSAPKPRMTQDHHVHATTASPGPPASIVEVAYMVGDLGGDRLLAITDTACSKSVMGQKWLESYLRLAKDTGVDTQFLDCHDDFRFGASRLFHANFTATIVIQIRDRVFLLRASVVQGEVPLLMSRGALSKLGMVYDLEGHSAQFKHLGIERFSLMTTDSGHPAIPVTPKRVPGVKWPSPQEWANSEVIIVPSAASQYVAFMTSTPDARDAPVNNAPLDPKENKTPSADHPPGQNIFYPKKINACVRNLLSAESFNLQHFAAWWSKTPISKDFWIERADSFIRIHVVPRRGLFDPSRWETSQTEVKDKLLGSVGLVRSSHGISCSTLTGLDAIHDLWQDQRDAQQPVLWVGRTVFSRAVARAPLYGPPPVVSAPRLSDGHLRVARQHLADEQDTVAVGGCAAESDGAHLVVGGRDPADHQRPQEDFRAGVKCPKRVSFDDSRAVEDSSIRAPDSDSTEGHQGTAAAVDPRCRDPREGRSHCDFRPPQEQTLQGGADSVPGMGDDGSQRARGGILGTRSGEPGELREGKASPRGGGELQSGDQLSSASPAREFGKLVLGVPLVRADRDGTSDEHQSGLSGEGNRDTCSAAHSDSQEAKHDIGITGGGEEAHGAGGAPGSPRGDRDPYVTACGLEGPTRLVNAKAGLPPTAPLESEGNEAAIDPARDVRMEAGEPEIVYEQQFPSGSEVAVELLSRDSLVKKDFSFGTCEKVVRLVCGLAKSLRKRSFHEGTESIALGAYSHGNYYGIIKKTYGLSQTAKYINAFMKYHGAKGQWSSFQLCHNCHVGCHRDAHNLVGTSCWTISFGSFSKGRLWLENDSTAQVATSDGIENVKLSDGVEAVGKVISTHENMTQFCPKTRHAVEEWEGDRFSIVAYTTRGIQELSRTERDVLRTFGFPLGKNEGTTQADREFHQRPKKSIRKALWKGAQRASAFFTLGFAAASSFLSEHMPAGKSPGQACLFEIGGTQMTYQFVEAGAHVIEPLSWDEYFDSECKIDVNYTIKNLKPNLVWFQGDVCPSLLHENIQHTIECQLDCGGSVVLQAQRRDPFWTSLALDALVNQHVHSCEDSGDLRTLRLGQHASLEHEGHPNKDSEQHVHEEYMTSREQQKTVDREGASAIRFEGNVPSHVQVALKRLH